MLHKLLKNKFKKKKKKKKGHSYTVNVKVSCYLDAKQYHFGPFSTRNRPFPTNDRVVQNPPCWRASSLLFPHWDMKTKASQASLVQVSLFQCPSAGKIMSLTSSMADFVSRDR